MSDSEIIIHENIPQRTADWLALRLGKPTASEFDSLVTPEFKIKTGEGPKTYLSKKVAEKWLNHALPGFDSFATEEGEIKEEEAIPWFELETGCDIKRVAFVENGRCGCSPDGLIGEDGGIEIKCPQAHTHVGYLLNGVVPKDYLPQVHFSLYATGRKWWKFMSYRKGFPALILTVERDEKIMGIIEEALTGFYEKFDAAIARLTQLKK